MNNQGSSKEQIFRFFILAFVGWFLFQNVFNAKKDTNSPDRPALTLVQAFQGIDPKQGPLLTPVQALAEEKKLNADIAKNGKDPLSYWARLRIGLMHQYIHDDLVTKERKSGFLGLGPRVKYFPAYDEIITHAHGDPVDAQALYQTGDLMWRQSTQNGGQPSSEAATALEALVHKGRGSSAFLDNNILVPAEVDPAKVPLKGVPPEGFKSVRVRDLRGTLEAPNLQGIPDRVNVFYSSKPYYKLFDAVVKMFGSQPNYSYGLAILFFAIITRSLLQPITKRQYDSMKGMALIAPEMKKIQERYKGKTEGDAQVQMMKEIRALQQRHGVNPMLGCGLAAIQMPIFFVFVYPLIQNYEPKMELVGASFLWISSLARPDIPLLVLYGISMFFSFRLSSTPPTDDMQRQQQMIMSFVFPFIFPFFIGTYPSAFTMYWMTYNAVSTFYQWRMLKAADPKKNVIKTLMGADLRVTDPTADAIPARPGSDKSDKKGSNAVENVESSLDSKSPSLVKSGDSLQNGSSNGSSNSSSSSNGSSSKNGAAKNGGPQDGKTPKAALNGTVMTPHSNGNANGNGNGGKKKKK
jgi:YidC/Oxa1 family membrane protein insertase